MKKKICYKIENLLYLLNGFSVKTINTLTDDEESAYASMDKYFVSRDDIVAIINYYGLWDSKVLKFTDGTKISMKSNNVNSYDKTIIRINNNNIISPKLIISDDYVEATKDLVEWLNNIGISNETLLTISEEFNIYDEIIYVGVPTPIMHSGHWGYSSEDLVLDEKEIEKVLNSIEDATLREKIKCILYARIFKKR